MRDLFEEVSLGAEIIMNNGDRTKSLSTEEYFNKIRPYLKDITNGVKKSDTWKIQLAIAINFISSKNSDVECAIHSKSDNIEILSHDKADDVIEELFESILFRYQIGLETSTKVSEFVFDCVHLLYYICHKLNPNRGGSYIDSPSWMKNKKSAINPINKKDKCFQYPVTVALNHEEDILKK